MLIDIVEVRVIQGYKLFLRFEDGVEGSIDVSKLIPFKGIFSKLQDPGYFATVTVNHELGTIVWDNGADIAPDYLYNQIKKAA